MRFTDTIKIAAPPAEVWALTIDVERLPRITPTITAASRLDDGPLRVGSRVRLKQPSVRATVWTVTELDAPSRFVWESRVLGVTTVATHDLVEDEDGTLQTLIVELSGRGSAVMASVAGNRIQAALASENAGFRERAEGR